ncbi:MAG: lactate utilization protein [Bacteroidetes bacterium]|nr:lactate utilization protein [Bacteroidota bacterium]
MASERAKRFTGEAERVAFDMNHRNIIRNNMTKYHTAVQKGIMQFAEPALATEKVSSLKKKVIGNLDKYLLEFTEKFEANGGTVFWASDAAGAVAKILDLARKYNAKTVVKSKSMTTEEICINEAMEEKQIDVVETDLGEFIVQIAGEKPYHIVTPAMHKSKEDIARLFNRKFGTSEDFTPEQMTMFVRKLLREKFRNAEVGITGANFLVADIGAVALTENEGNALMSVSFPKIHIVLAGIEKVIPSLRDMELVWSVLASKGTGQKITVYNSLLSGPAKKGEDDGPEEMIVILLDNGRSGILSNPEVRDSLACIRCGACLNNCPVYKNIGGYTYDTIYSGPIGSVITPHLRGMEEFGHLSFASSLCGKCSEVCPAGIDIPAMLLANRRMFIECGYSGSKEKRIASNWKKAMKNRRLLNLANGNLKNACIKFIGAKAWGPRRELPVFSGKSFNRQWRLYRP